MNKLTILILIGFVIAAAVFAGSETNRFHGGSYDGYRLATITNTTIDDGLPSGTVLMIR